VVYGLWGLVTLVPLIAGVKPPGASLLAGVLVLALMILPTVAVVADGAVQRLPAAFHLGGAALGMRRHAVAFRIVVPAARSGLTTALVLALGRALGETMALLMVTGNLVQYPSSLFDPVRTLASNIALEMAYAQGIHRSALFVSGLILALLVAGALAAAAALNPDGGRHAD
jgi:phosphate transport system permease protein